MWSLKEDSIDITMDIDLNNLDAKLKSAESKINKFSESVEWINPKINLNTSETITWIDNINKKLKLLKKSSNFKPKIDISELKEKINSLKTVAQKTAIDTWKSINWVEFSKLSNKIIKLKVKLIELKKLQSQLVKAWWLKTDSYKRVSTAVNDINFKLTEANKRMRRLRTTWDQTVWRLTSLFNKFSISLSSVVRAFAWFYIMQKAIAAINFVTNWAADAFIEFESALANVNKAMDLTKQELDLIWDSFLDMSKTMPTTAVELTNIGASLWRMWLEKENVIALTQVIWQLKTTVDWIDAQQAAEELFRLLDVSWQTVTDFDNISSALTWLANNFKTTEWGMLHFVNQISWLWATTNMSAQDLLWFAAAFTDAWIKAEWWWTAFVKATSMMQTAVVTSSEKLKIFWSLIGQTADEFKKSWNENSADTMIKVLEWINSQWEKSVLVLQELFWKNIRVQNALTRVAAKHWLLEKAVRSSREEMVKNSARITEYNKRLNTTEAMLQVNTNRWKAWQTKIWKSTSKVKLALSDLWIQILAFSSFVWVILDWLLLVIQIFLSWVVVGFGWMVSLAGWIIWWLIDIFKNIWVVLSWLVDNAKIAAHNFWEAFQNVPTAIQSILRIAMKAIIWLINAPGRLINLLVKKLTDVIPWLSELLWNIKVPPIDSSVVDWLIKIEWAVEPVYQSFKKLSWLKFNNLQKWFDIWRKISWFWVKLADSAIWWFMSKLNTYEQWKDDISWTWKQYNIKDTWDNLNNVLKQITDDLEDTEEDLGWWTWWWRHKWWSRKWWARQKVLNSEALSLSDQLWLLKLIEEQEIFIANNNEEVLEAKKRRLNSIKELLNRYNKSSKEWLQIQKEILSVQTSIRATNNAIFNEKKKYLDWLNSEADKEKDIYTRYKKRLRVLNWLIDLQSEYADDKEKIISINEKILDSENNIIESIEELKASQKNAANEFGDSIWSELDNASDKVDELARSISSITTELEKLESSLDKSLSKLDKTKDDKLSSAALDIYEERKKLEEKLNDLKRKWVDDTYLWLSESQIKDMWKDANYWWTYNSDDLLKYKQILSDISKLNNEEKLIKENISDKDKLNDDIKKWKLTKVEKIIEDIKIQREQLLEKYNEEKDRLEEEKAAEEQKFADAKTRLNKLNNLKTLIEKEFTTLILSEEEKRLESFRKQYYEAKRLLDILNEIKDAWWNVWSNIATSNIKDSLWVDNIQNKTDVKMDNTFIIKEEIDIKKAWKLLWKQISKAQKTNNTF